MILHINYNAWFWLIVSILAVWRITNLLCYEKGPWDIMIKLRIVLFKIKLGSVIECFHCTSMWFSILFCSIIYHPSIELVFLILAIAGGASILENFNSNLFNYDQSYKGD